MTMSSRDQLSQLPLIISPVKVTNRGGSNKPSLSVTDKTPRKIELTAKKEEPEHILTALEEKAKAYKEKPLKGVASILNLSELAKGLPRKGSLYKDA